MGNPLYSDVFLPLKVVLNLANSVEPDEKIGFLLYLEALQRLTCRNGGDNF